MDENPEKSQAMEDEERKKMIFDCMSEKRQKGILKKGYEDWNPFVEPKDPIDIRKDKSQRTTQELITEFFQSKVIDDPSTSYEQGVLEACLGIMNDDEKIKGMYEFACWHNELLERENLK